MAQHPVVPETISIEEFRGLLDQYTALVESLSASKGSKPGQKTLSELDEFRYHEAIDLFASENPKRPMSLEDVKLLVDWKLRHGKFRPTLMKLVSSNDEETVQDTIKAAMDAYWAQPDPSAALDAISKLRGIGPATASLLLSVGDPERVIFFSDEAFYWLCCGGRKAPVKYSPKEYRELNGAAQALVQRLNVGATDVEKVAYVVLKKDTGAAPEPARGKKPVPAAAKRDLKTENKEVKPKKEAKRKEQPVVEETPGTELRRSKRNKSSH